LRNLKEGIQVEKAKKAQEKLDKAGHKIDDWVEDTAEKHNYPKWKVWAGLTVGALASIGAAHLLGWI
jgi:hypothetical protein